MTTKPTLGLFIALLLLTFSCKEEIDPVEIYPEPVAPSIHITHIPGTQATLQATYYSTIVDSGFVGKITFIQGWGKATFKSTNGAPLRPAKVSTEGVILKESKGIYSNSPGSTFGIDFGSDVLWEVSSTVSNPEIKQLLNSKVPEIGDLNVGDTLYTSRELVLTIDITNPFTNLGSIDSINYLIKGPRGKLHKRTHTLDPLTFTTAEISNLGKGKGYIQCEAFRFKVSDYNGYKVGYVNKGVINKAILIY